MNKLNKIIVKTTILILVVTLMTPLTIDAAATESAENRASYYLDSYSAFVYPAGDDLIQVYFSVTGTNYMDELGALSIQIYECSTNSTDIDDWTWKKTFTHDSTDGMLSYNDDYHSGHVDYNGRAGRYYKAYVCIWGGKDGDGDTRYFWTSAKKAT